MTVYRADINERDDRKKMERNKKSANPSWPNRFVLLVRPTGFEPVTYGLEVRFFTFHTASLYVLSN